MNEQNARVRDLTAGKGFALYLLVLGGMLSVGTVLQGVHLQVGLILTEVLVVFLPALLFRLVVSRGGDWPSLKSSGLAPRWFIWVAVTATLLGLSANLVTALIVELFPSFKELAAQYEAMVRTLLFPDDLGLAALGILAVSVSAPLCEEFLFRGVLLPAQMTSRRPVALVVITNGLLFSLLHVNPFGFIALAVVGAFFAHLTILTKSLWPAIFAHAVLNTVNGVIVPRLVQDSTTTAIEPALLEIVIGCIITVPLVVLAWTWGARRIPPRPDA